jgi:hypothetical protein
MQYNQHIITISYNQVFPFPFIFIGLAFFKLLLSIFKYTYCENWIGISYNYISTYKQHTHNVICLNSHYNPTQITHQNQTMINYKLYIYTQLCKFKIKCHEQKWRPLVLNLFTCKCGFTFTFVVFTSIFIECGTYNIEVHNQ